MRQVISWLENFEENEVLLALDFLFYLEYISFPELQLRLESQLKSLEKYFGSEQKYLLVPYAKYPKSNDIVMYLISKCPTYAKLDNEQRVDITLDIEKYPFKEKYPFDERPPFKDNRVVLVYVDDFIGSGKSFDKWHKKNNIANIFGANFNIHEEQAIVAAIIMEDGSQFMKFFYSDIKVFAEFRSKIFSRTNSPFNLVGNRSEMRSLCLKYGKEISTRFIRPNKVLYDPFGFEKSEALVAFDYGTPNNSLSIIWGDANWKPIFPRSAKSRMKKSSEIKSEASFYLGLMDKLNINFNDDINMDIGDDINITLSVRDDHAILVYLILADMHYSNLQVCQVLGITLSELKKIVSNAHKKKLVNIKGGITRNGTKLLNKLKKNSNIYKFRENDKLEIRDKKIFVPKTFRNLT